MTPRRVRSARSAALPLGELPFASRDESIIAKKPRENQARRNEIMARTKSRRICRAGAEGVFRRNAISRESPVHQRQVGGLEPTVAREHVCGPDVISTATVNGAREGARVEIMSVGCPQTAGRASRSGQVPDYLRRNTPHRVRATTISLAARRCQNPADVTSLPLSQSSRRSGYA